MKKFKEKLSYSFQLIKKQFDPNDPDLLGEPECTVFHRYNVQKPSDEH